MTEWVADELSFTPQFLTISDLLNEDRSIKIIHLSGLLENSVSELLFVTILSIAITYSKMVPVWSSPSEQLKAVCESKLKPFFLTFCFRATTVTVCRGCRECLSGASRTGMNMPLSVSWPMQYTSCSELEGQEISVWQIDLKSAFKEDSCSGMLMFHSLVYLLLSLPFYICLLLQFTTWEGDKDIDPRFQKRCLQRVANIHPEVVLENCWGQDTSW